LPESVWQQCINRLQDELPSQQFNTWIRPLQASRDDHSLTLVAPNRFIKDFVAEKYSQRITELVRELEPGGVLDVSLEIGGARNPVSAVVQPMESPGGAAHSEVDIRPALSGHAVAGRSAPAEVTAIRSRSFQQDSPRKIEVEGALHHQPHLVENYRFDSFVEGKSNQLALAAAQQVAENPGDSYNPLFLYGGVGLGKTHLMHAVGNALKAQNPQAKVVYLHSERFVADMVKALQLNAITDFKRYYRSVDALLIDDIQFFAKKERSQEEFFHTFNALLEGGQQMILTCDRDDPYL